MSRNLTQKHIRKNKEQITKKKYNHRMIFKQVKHPCQVVLEVEENADGTAE